MREHPPPGVDGPAGAGPHAGGEPPAVPPAEDARTVTCRVDRLFVREDTYTVRQYDCPPVFRVQLLPGELQPCSARSTGSSRRPPPAEPRKAATRPRRILEHEGGVFRHVLAISLASVAVW